MKFDFDDSTQSNKIELLPLIDVVFLILVVFVYAFMSMKVLDVVQVDLPDASPSQIEVPEPLVVSINRNSDFFFEKKNMTLEKLCDVIKRKISLKKRPVLVNGDKTSQLGPVLSLIEGLKAVGVKDVAFVCEDRIKQ